MTYYLMADSEYDEFKRLESKALEIDALKIIEASANAPKMKMEISGESASIEVNGVLTNSRIGFLDFFGKPQTVWGDISNSIKTAESKGIKNFTIYGNSGGGTVDGMFETMDALAETKMNTSVVVTGQAQSAMYMLASQADMISSTKPYNLFGSVGVKTSIGGNNEVSNTDSPKKISSSVDENGKYHVQETLDEIYGMITPRMAKARNTTIENINSNWGKGGTMTAKTALSRGMIDMIQEPKTAGRSGATNKGNAMNKEQLKAEHPDLYASVYNEGKEAGKAEFKELATAHAELAEMSGDTSRALSDIKAGNAVTPSCTVHHTKMVINQKMISARDEETPAPVAEGEDSQVQALGKNEAEDVKKVYAELGLEVEL